MKEQIRYMANGDRSYFLDGYEVQEFEYRAATQARDEKNLLEMLNAGRPPHGISDCTFMRGTANGRQFDGQEHVGDRYRAVTEQNGGSHVGKKYISGLARFPGDPEAWVDSRGDVERVLEKRGWGCEGSVNVKAKEPIDPPRPGPDVADDLLDQYTMQIASQDPRPDLVDTADLREQVRERIKPKRKPEVTKASVA